MDLKIQLIADWLSGHYSKRLLSSKYFISRPTVDKWIARYQSQGPEGLCDLSRRPQNSPNQTPDKIVQRLLALKRNHPHWGPKKINDLFQLKYPRLHCPADSTTGCILKKAGLVKPRKHRQWIPPYPNELTRSSQPNDVWNIDFKGQAPLGDGQWCYPLTVTDDYSRYLLAVDALLSTRSPDVKAALERLFHANGLPDVLKSDNGYPFASKGLGGLSQLSIWLVKLGIRPERITKGKPTENGRHERMHKTLKAETMQPMQLTQRAQQARFNQFRAEYNHWRSHEALGRKRPVEVYQHSHRRYVPNRYEVNYDLDMQVRRIRHGGEMKWKGRLIYVHSGLAKEWIGLRRTGNDDYDVYFSMMKIGRLDERTMKIIRL
ncbi:DDE-type integrase/transposase/recombinase, partial [Celerinatantimonas sp. YJH-8]|uniref:DDE-type integrase/transposase/recombinase n=1 Tax=Celerinatantimonas sp. YJH-8 TaxID=3228714 RepID=UPI0038CB521F